MNVKQQIFGRLITNKTYLFDKYDIKQLALFGSIARGDYNENSDIDLLVEFNTPVGMAFIDLGDELEHLLDKTVDLVSKGGIKEKYFRSIERDLVYV